MRLELFYPHKPYFRLQAFGDSRVCAEDNGLPPTQRKLTGKVGAICPPGYVEFYPLLGMKGHTGEDLAAGRGVPIRASHDGKVREIQTEPERGLGVGIVSHDRREMGSHGEHYAKTRYWHLLSINVTMDQEVKCGDLLGLADNTGYSTGDHLHFELKPVEFNGDGSHYNVEQNNGYFGSIDPHPFWNGVYAVDFAGLTTQLSEIAKVVLELSKKIAQLIWRK